MSNRSHLRHLRYLRVPMAALALYLLVFASPDPTMAPLIAAEPQLVIPGPSSAAAASTSDIRLDELVVLMPASSPSKVAAQQNENFAAAMAAARTSAKAHGITFAVVRDGELLFSGAEGHQPDGSTPLLPDDVFVIGSATKTFVAAAILQLAEEGRLDLDDAVRDYLSELPNISDQITIRQLLDHSSGLADLFNSHTRSGLEQQPQRVWDVDEVLATLRAPWYEPGVGWAYSNTNYFLLGLVIEKITGSSLAEELEARFFAPLDLENTRVLTAADDGELLSPAWSTIFWASGAMTSSAVDLAHWGDALYGDQILNASSRVAMLTTNNHNYGLGVQRLELPGASGYGHSGLLHTYTSLLVYLPAHDATLALLVNRTEVDLGAMLSARPADGKSLLELVGEAE